jgi:hypothetical protein
LIKLQQYISVADKIDHIQELVKIEVDIKCHGQVYEVLSTESLGRNWNGCICNNKKTAAIKAIPSEAELKACFYNV